MDKLLDIFKTIKDDFCSLTTYKLRGESLEIITPFSTLNNKFVSVFIKEIKGKYVISDAGWTDLNYYDVSISEESNDIIKTTPPHSCNNDLYKINSQSALDRYYNTNNPQQHSKQTHDLTICSEPRTQTSYIYRLSKPMTNNSYMQ